MFQNRTLSLDLRVFDFDWNRDRSLPSGTELSYTVDTTLICCKTTQSQLTHGPIRFFSGRF